MSSNCSEPCIFVLNDDVLDLIIETAATTNLNSISSLSRTCNRIRLRCLPFLFKERTSKTYFPVERRNFFPRPVRPYISVLHFQDQCRDRPRISDIVNPPSRRLRHTPDPLLCGVYSTPFLARVLRRMPRLQSVSFTLYNYEVHGIPWSVVQLVLSLPFLRHFTVYGHCIAPSLLPGEELALDDCVPLTSFSYTMKDYCSWRNMTNPSAHQAVSLIIQRTHQTLEKLTLVTEIAPLDEICTTLTWPNLRELCLRGEHITVGNPPLPLISMFAHMPLLRRLELKLAQAEGAPPQPFWPLHHVAEWPWPDLRHLTLSCPQVQDQVYDALPPTLESLSLRYTPHMMNAVCNYAWDLSPVGICWQWPLLRSSEMLDILRRCRCPNLSLLQLEYQEDDADEALLQHISASFPALTTLKLIQYRAGNADTEPRLGRLLRMLGALPRLQIVHIHLDLPNTPRPYYRDMHFGRLHPAYDDAWLEEFAGRLQALADVLAGAGAPSLQTIWLWTPYDGPRWRWNQYVVVREEGADGLVRAENISPRALMLPGMRK